MSTTIVPPYDGPIPPFDNDELRMIVRTCIVESQGNNDKAGELDDAAYYQGQVDALESIMAWLLGARGFAEAKHPFITDGGTPGHCVWCGEIFDHEDHEPTPPTKGDVIRDAAERLEGSAYFEGLA